MIIKSTEIQDVLKTKIEKPIAIVCNSNDTANDDFVFDHLMFDTEAVATLQSIIHASNKESSDSVLKGTTENKEVFSRTASVKFMITKQDEMELRILGYSNLQIDKIKPQEAVDIILSGTKAGK